VDGTAIWGLNMFLLPDNDDVLNPISGILQINYRSFGHYDWMENWTL
jgi:hypothetical protein